MLPAVSIDDIFLHAMELEDPQERERYLDSICAGQENLREQIDKLLSIAPQLGSFLETPAVTSWNGETKPNSESVDLLGQSLGPYQLIRLAGKGGMGEVYLAEQQAPIRRNVAIKVIRSGLATAPMLARFAHESHLLGLMDHPNIARVLDAGTTPSGCPFIAMEWVEGVHINAFCDQQRYTIRQRVELVVTVCQAVQHAHQKGIIHRDLKPANVLVTVKDGLAVPKIIDFGVARGAQAELDDQERMTHTGQIIGTFEYMAPEQVDAANGDIDTRADVFALGALLYELLTGTSPIPQEDFRKATVGERLRWIREVEPVRPSQSYAGLEDLVSVAANRQAGVSQLPRLVEHELDWICLKCLEKDRARRYETINALAQDLLRYLSGEPVQAGPPTMVYRFKKFAARNRNLLAVATIFGLLLLGAAVIGTWQAIRLARLHEQSQTNLTAANSNLNLAISAVDQFCTKVSEDLRLKKEDLRPLRKELLSTAVDFHEQLVDLRERSGAARIDLARSQAKLGQLLMEIDSPERAIASFQLAIEEYLALGAAVDSPEIGVEFARCYYHLALLLGRSSQLNEARRAAEQAANHLQRLLRKEPTLHLPRSTLANVRGVQADIALNFQQFSDGEAFYQMAIDEYGVLAKDLPDDPFLLSNWALAYSQLGSGILSRRLSRWREAEPLLREALRLIQRAISLNPDMTYAEVRLAVILRALGQVCKVTQREDEAVNHLSEAVETLEALRIKEPSVRSHAIMLAGTYIDLSRVHDLNNQPLDVRASVEAAVDLLEPLAGQLDADPHLAMAKSQLAGILLNEGDLNGAEQQLNQAIDSTDKLLQQSPGQAANEYSSMLERRAILRSRQGKLKEALSDYDRAIEFASLITRSPRRIGRSRLLLELGDHRQAMNEVRNTLAELPHDTPDHVWTNTLMNGAKLSALCSATALSDKTLTEKEQFAISEEYATAAIDMLNQAIEKGFRDLESLATDPEFETMRKREDFQALRSKNE